MDDITVKVNSQNIKAIFRQLYDAVIYYFDRVDRNLTPNRNLVIRISEETRTLEQNAFMWAILTDISRQVPWHGIRLSKDEYKDLLTAGLRKTKTVPNIEGNGFVILGQSTSKMSKREFSELMELCLAFAAEKGVVWSDKSLNAIDEMIASGAIKVD
jgi:hypothetical protein